MIQLPLDPRQLAGPSLIVIVMIVLHLFPAEYTHQMVFNRDAIDSGAVWQLVTANFLHSNLNHLLLNLGGIILIWALHGQYYTVVRFVLLFVVCGLAGTLLIYYSAIEFKTYHGASGALHGLLLWGAFNDVLRKYKTGWLIVLVVTLKLLWEYISGPDPFISELIEVSVANDAHLGGAIAGALVFLFTQKKRSNQERF